MRCSFRGVSPWKMATVKSLEDMLSSEVDESAVTELVGSLEFQLSSSNIHAPSQDPSGASVTVNHVNNSAVVEDAVIRLLDGQKHALPASTQPGNTGKTSIEAQAIVTAASTVMVTLPGALPASGYLSQVPGPNSQTFFSSHEASGRPITTNHQDVKLIFTTQSSTVNSSIATRSNSKAPLSNCSAPTAPVSMVIRQPLIAMSTINPASTPTSTPALSAIHDLAAVASQQTPMIIPSTTGAPLAPTTTAQQTITTTKSNGSKGGPVTRMQLRERANQKNLESVNSSNNKAASAAVATTTIATMITKAQETVAQTAQNAATTTTVVLAGTPVLATQASTTTSSVTKTQIAAPQSVSVVSQVVTNPGLLPSNVQIINVNPRLTATSIAGNKALAPRVVLSNPLRIAAAPQIMTRPGVAGQRSMQPAPVRIESYRQMHVRSPALSTPKYFPIQANKNTITLQPGMVRGTAIIVKTENGPLQVVNLGPAGTALPGGTTYRLQSIPSGAQTVRSMSPQQMTVTVPVSGATIKGSPATVSAGQTIVGTILQQGSTNLNAVNARIQSANIASQAHQTLAVKVNGNISTPLTIQTTTPNSQAPSAPSQMSPNTAKKKCKNFLSTLIRLADEQPPSVAKSVRSLIQGIIDGSIQAEDFTAKLQKELNSAPQPYLVPFLKKNLPYLRHSLITKELTIEGVRPPPPGALSLPHPSHAGQKRPQPGTQVRVMSTPSTPGGLTQLLQTNQNITQRFAAPRAPGTVGNQAKSILVSTAGTKLAGSAASSPATVGALQAKSSLLLKGSSMLTVKDRGKSSFSALRDDDDINDVAAMGGVNLIEESQKILASNSELVGTQIRSCKDESFILSGALQRRVLAIAVKQGLDEVAPDVTALVAHAAQEKLKTLLGKLAVIAEHRVDNPKSDARYEATQDVKAQIKFLEELDRLERRRHEEQEREILLRAAKSRSKLEDPEQAKLKQKAKEMQRAELEEMRQREANTTALLAIGPRKKMKLDSGTAMPNQGGAFGTSTLSSKAVPRPRIKRVNLRDLLYLMEQERETVRTPLLYKSYMK